MTEQTEGEAILRADWVGTTVFTFTAVAATVTDAGAVPAAAVALSLFAAGITIFLWAYAIAVGRSRTDAIGIGGLFFLAGEGTAPSRVRRNLLGALGAQVVVALATAGARPFTSLAFGVLVPVYGMALTGLWGARYGRFDLRRATGPTK